jgi:hypothetical protein
VRTPNFHETHHHLRSWTRHELPYRNRAVEEHGTVGQWLAPYRHAIARVIETAHDIHDAGIARQLLQLLGFITSSVERHLQAHGDHPGAGVHALGVEPTLVHLGHIAAHVPRDSHYTYWLDNAGEAPLTFTGSMEETAYIRIVHHTHHLHDVAAAALRPLTTGHDTHVSHPGTDAVHFALHAEERLCAIYETFLHECVAVHGHAFALHLPPYLASYPVGGEMTHGPDAHHIASTIELDLLLGNHAAYHDHLPHLDHHDRERLETAALHPIAAHLLDDAAAAALEKLVHARHANARQFEAIHHFMHHQRAHEPVAHHHAA